MTGRFAMDELAVRLEELIEVLEAADERYWARCMRRALEQINANRLAGVSQVLAAFGGEDTFSDLVLLPQLEAADRRRFVVMNRRLEHLRTTIFELANEVASSTASPRT